VHLGALVASDAFWSVYVPVQSHICLNDTVLVNLPNPYNPCFILDLELAEEYVRSHLVRPRCQQAVCRWGVRERAAMGLCLDDSAAFFKTRYLVP